MDQFVVGIIRGSYGLEGMFKIESTSGEYDHFHDMREVTLRKGETERHAVVEFVSVKAGTLLMKCAGIDTPEDAKKLSGWKIVVPRENACPLHEGEYYISDLIGCSLIYEDTRNGLAAGSAPVIGTVTDVLEGGAGDLLEVSISESRFLRDAGIESEKHGVPRKVLIPFKEEFIGPVDLQGKIIRLMHLWILE